MNIKRALEELDKMTQYNQKIYAWNLKGILNALAEPVECEHVWKITTNLEVTPQQSYCVKCKAVKTDYTYLPHPKDPIRELYEKYNKPGNYINTVTGIAEMWQAIKQHCEKVG